jgi:GAF domain-containing protein
MNFIQYITQVKREFFELKSVKHECECIKRVATAMVKAESREEMVDLIVSESKRALNADVVCVYLLQNDDYYEMVADIGCTEEFRAAVRRIPRENLPLANLKNPHETIFFGTAQEFKKEVPGNEEIIDRSGRDSIGYAPLVINEVPIGILGFSYFKPPKKPLNK